MKHEGSEPTVELVQICSFTSEMEADIAKSALEAFGIECMISRDDCGGQRPHLDSAEAFVYSCERKTRRVRGKF